MLLLFGIKQTSALTCTSTWRQQAPAGCSGAAFPSGLSPSTSELCWAKNKHTACRQHLPDLTFPLLCYSHLCATTCQTGISKLFINAHSSRKKACASCYPVVHLLHFPIVWLFSFGLVLWVFPNKDLLVPLNSLLLPLGWLPTCPNRCIIKRKTTPGNWQSLLIEIQGGNNFAQGKSPTHRP